MKKVSFKSLLLLTMVFFLHYVSAQEINVYSKVATVNFKELKPQNDARAFMSNIHAPMVDQYKSKSVVKTTPTFTLIQKDLGVAPQPRLITTITPGPNHDSGYPYDNGIAVSSTGQVVTTTNQGVYVYDMDDDLAYSSGYHAFLRSPGGKFDPQVAYDSQNDRFIVIILRTGVAANAGVDIAVSASNDPTGYWHSYFVPNTHTHPSSWVDFPHLGVSGDRVYIHANIYNDSFTLESNIWDIPTADLYAGGDITVVKHVTNESGIRFVPGATGVYGNKLYGVVTSITNAINLYVFENGNMNGPYSISTELRDGLSQFAANGKILNPGGDGSNSYTYVKDDVLYYASAGTFNREKDSDPILIFGKVMINPNDYAASTATHPVYIMDGERNYSYVSANYAGYSNDEGIAGTIITGLYGSPTEYMGTIAYHVDPEENFSDPLIVQQGVAHVDDRIGDYIQATPDPSGTREIWVSGQFGSSTETNAIANVQDTLYLGNVIAKIQVDESTPTAIEESFVPIRAEKKLFPNPAVNIATIQFSIQETGIYSAKLYSNSGRMVDNLTSKRLKPGIVGLSFNVQAFPSGIYLVVIENEKGERVTSEKLVIK